MIVVQVTITCDGDKCGALLEYSSVSQKRALQDARVRGWSVGKHRNRCPACRLRPRLPKPAPRSLAEHEAIVATVLADGACVSLQSALC